MNKPIEFAKLLAPGSIGTMRTRNRIVMSPMATNFATPDGHVTDLLINHYEQRAKGGVGLIITEGTCIDFPRGKGWTNELSVDGDEYILGLRRLVDSIHKHGAKVALQLHHAGREAKQSFTGCQALGPSPLAAPGGDEPKEMTADEIEQMVGRFAEAARQAKKIGFDGVELHAAHGYLLAEFISRVSNKRQDEYGGELVNRARFLCKAIGAIRGAVGEDYPVWCRLNGEERAVEGGLTLEECCQVAQMAQEAGCNAIHISAYGYGGEAGTTFPELAGGLVPLAEGVKKAVSIPVIAVGAITPEVGERVLEENRADFIAMGRELLCDPELPNKLIQGRVEDIVPCIHCLSCGNSLSVKGGKVACAVNATLGYGPELKITPAEKAKRILVIGGGPAGLEAARIAALRGHEVTLYERERELGGQMVPASVPPHKEKIKDYIDYLTTQLHKLKVKVEIGKQMTPDLIQELRPDSVVVATGAIPTLPSIPGLDKMKAAFAQEILRGAVDVGERVVIIGGGMIGCETAEFLVERGKKITIIELLPRIAADMTPLRRVPLLSRLRAKNVAMLASTTCGGASEDGIAISGKEGQRQTIPADSIVIATGSKANKDIYQALQDKIREIHLVGDAVEPRTILDAVSEGFRIGIAL